MLAVFCLASEHHQANIVGYPLNHYGVTGDIEKQVIADVVAPLSAELAKARGSQVVMFTIIGSADQTGDGVANERLAKDRANELATYLSGKFPSAKFVPLTRGDERNARMTSVGWDIVPPAPADPSRQAGINPMMLAGLVCMVALLVCAIYAIGFRRNKEVPQQPVEQVSSNLRTMPSLEEGSIAVVEVTVSGLVYSISVIRKDGLWVTPFPNKTGDGFVTKKTLRDVGNSFRNFLNNPAWGPMVHELIAAGKINQKEAA
jgi:hypothetical protein